MMHDFPEPKFSKKKTTDEIRDDRYSVYDETFRERHPIVTALITALVICAVFSAGFVACRFSSAGHSTQQQNDDSATWIRIDLIAAGRDTKPGSSETNFYWANLVMEKVDEDGNILYEKRFRLEKTLTGLTTMTTPQPMPMPTRDTSQDPSRQGYAGYSDSEAKEKISEGPFQMAEPPRPTPTPTLPVVTPMPVPTFEAKKPDVTKCPEVESLGVISGNPDEPQ